MAKEYHEELEGLRKKIDRLEKALSALSGEHAEVVDEKKRLKHEKSNNINELKKAQESVKQLNADRHRLIKELEDMTNESLQHMQQRDKHREHI